MKKLTLFIGIALTQWLLNLPVLAEENANSDIEQLYERELTDLFDMETEAKANIGSRGEAVDLLEAKVPIDVITAEQINRTGYTELSKVLQRFWACQIIT